MNKLQEACIISHEHWLKELEQAIAILDIDIPEIKIPEKTKGQIVSIKDSKSKSKKNKSIKRNVIKILVIAAIIASLLIAVVAYAPFKDFIIETFPDHNAFINSSKKICYPKKIEIEYLPEGFVMTGEDNMKLSILQTYECNEKKFYITKGLADVYIQISDVYSNKIEFYKNDVKYTLFDGINGGNCTVILWLTDKYSYDMVGFNMTNEELIAIAKSIE